MSKKQMQMDYNNASIRKLFLKQLGPNILGMALTALFVIVDGIFVGRGIGSEALAAVNIVVPIFTIMTGVGLMFGMGAAILAAISLSKGKRQAANQVATLAFGVSSLIMAIYTIVAVCIPDKIVVLFGAPEEIIPLASKYLVTLSLFAIFQTAISSLPYFVRISSPNFAMLSMAVATILNIGLDYLFIFVFRWGLFGAALATGIGQVVGTAMLLHYLIKKSPTIKLVKLKHGPKNIKFGFKSNIHIMQLGFSVLLSEITISVMSIAGNYTFAHYTGVDGVAAFSIVNYIFPVVYMIFNAIIQSAQPIISYNYGRLNRANVLKSLRLALVTAVTVGALFVLIPTLFNSQLVSLFIPDGSSPAWLLAVDGLPYFSIDFLFFGINVVFIGYYMSIENSRRALIITIIRGLLPVMCFAIIPLWLPIKGIWLSVPIAEIVSTLIICSGLVCGKCLIMRRNKIEA